MLTRTDQGGAGFHRRGKPNSPRPLTPAERRRIEAIVESLIDLLDEADGDPDLEPSLGWSRTCAQGALDTDELLHDLEEEHDGREPGLVPVRLDAPQEARPSTGA